jgi:hypothetical protein
MIRASSARCRCGQEFDSTSIVKKTSRRCPLCGRPEDGAAASCECGYDFSTPASDVRRQIVRRNRIAWIWIVSGLPCIAVAGTIWFFALPKLLGFLAAAGGSWLIARGINGVRWTRHELAAIDRALPKARLLE